MLRADTTDGKWKSVQRDVRADLARFEPGLSVTAINGFALRAGDLRLDDLRLGPAGDAAFQFVEKENGESASRWAVFYPYPDEGGGAFERGTFTTAARTSMAGGGALPRYTRGVARVRLRA